MKSVVFYITMLSFMLHACEGNSEKIDSLNGVSLYDLRLEPNKEIFFFDGVDGTTIKTCKHTYTLLARLKKQCSTKSYVVSLDLSLDTNQHLFIKNLTIEHIGTVYKSPFDVDAVSGYPLERLIVIGASLKVSDTTSLKVKRFIGIGFEMNEKYGFTESSKCFRNIDTLGLGAFIDVMPSFDNASIIETFEIPIPIKKLQKKAKKVKSLRASFQGDFLLRKYHKENCRLAKEIGVDLTLVKVEEGIYHIDDIPTPAIDLFQRGDTVLLNCE